MWNCITILTRTLPGRILGTWAKDMVQNTLGRAFRPGHRACDFDKSFTLLNILAHKCFAENDVFGLGRIEWPIDWTEIKIPSMSVAHICNGFDDQLHTKRSSRYLRPHDLFRAEMNGRKLLGTRISGHLFRGTLYWSSAHA